MNRKIFLGLMLLATMGLQSCAIFGIHFTLHNPKKPGKMPKFSEEEVLLGALTRYRSCFDVHYYDLSVGFLPDQKKLEGKVSIHAAAVTDIDTLQLDLHPNLAILSLVNQETGEALPYERRERAVFVKLPQQAGDEFVIEVAYAGKPVEAKKPPWYGGFVWENDEEKNPWLGVACESDGASLWWPLKDHTSDEPDSMRLHYTVPTGLVAVGNGQYEGKEDLGNTTRYDWFISYPINTYNVTVYVGNFELISDEFVSETGKKLALSYYVLPEHVGIATSHFKQVKPILALYEKRFGEYPWYRDGFKLVESPYAGMEHQTAIAYGNGYRNDLNATTDYIVLHEVAHEWWGNSVTATDMADVWLQEGFATYAEALYLESTEGEGAYQSHLNFYKIFIKNKYPLVGVRDRRWFDSKLGSDVYQKGAWTLHSLRRQMENDPLFLDILKTFAETYRYQIVESSDFINLVNEKTGEDYSWFFDHYLKQNEIPVLEYHVTDSGKMSYRYSNTAPSFNKLKVRVTIAGEPVTIVPSTEWQELQLSQQTAEGDWDFFFPLDQFVIPSENKKMKEQ
ncbi:MAG: M1 family metallopeptidase [Bacteroidia bacterium]|nr:M1 family metallopeptidase [Bacteroidia bacterium]